MRVPGCRHPCLFKGPTWLLTPFVRSHGSFHFHLVMLTLLTPFTRSSELLFATLAVCLLALFTYFAHNIEIHYGTIEMERHNAKIVTYKLAGTLS